MKAAVAVAACVLIGAPAAAASDATLRETLRHGVAEVERTPDTVRLRDRLVVTIATLRCDHGTSRAGRDARELAIAGFRSTLRGVDTQLSMRAHDSGRLEAAVRDAKRADRYLNRGANLLRAAGRALGLRVGLVNGR